jgi:hypothetical protein
LEIPAITLKDPGQVDFMLNNLQKLVVKVKEHIENATVLDELLISAVISSSSNFLNLRYSFGLHLISFQFQF